MKKFFTLIAAVAMAASVNAQTESFTVPTLTQNKDGVEYTGERVLKTENAQITLKDDNEPYKAKYDTNITPYTQFLQGTNNPKDANGGGYKADNHNLPAKGAYYIFKASKDGDVKLVVQIGATKPLFVADGETGENSVEKTLVSKDGITVSLQEDQSPKDKFYGTINFSVSADKEYYVFCTGSKLALYGYEFTPTTSTGITNVNAASSANSGKTYNLAGQEVSGSYKGLVIKNGKKYVK